MKCRDKYKQVQSITLEPWIVENFKQSIGGGQYCLHVIGEVGESSKLYWESFTKLCVDRFDLIKFDGNSRVHGQQAHAIVVRSLRASVREGR